MKGIYDIFRGREKIGKAEVCREGLYYRFRCCCDLTDREICRINVRCGDKTESLGIPAPDGDCFYLQTRLPVSRFSKGEPVFQIACKSHKSGEWMPVLEEMPFDRISELEYARAEERDGQMGIFIPEEALRDSGQSPSPDCE